MKTGTGKAIPGHNHISTDTAAQVIMIHIKAVPDHDIGIIATTTGVAHGKLQILHTGIIAINPAMAHHIHHTTDHPHTGVHHTTPEIEAAHNHIHPTNPHDEIHIGYTHTPGDHEANHITRRMPE